MDFEKLSAERYSLRKFDTRPVEQEKLDLILEAGRNAPTAHNNQPQRIFVFRSPEALEKADACMDCHFHAPVVIGVGYDPKESWHREHDGKDHGEIDAAKRSLWDDIYRFLGIPSVENKTERMITGEVKSQNASSEIMSLDPLNCRREAADAWNRLNYSTAARADRKPIEVVWAQDYRSDNFEAENNKLTNMEEGADGTV